MRVSYRVVEDDIIIELFHIIITHYLIILFLHHMRVSHQAGRDIWLLLSDFPAHTSHHQTRERECECVLKNYQKLSRSILFVYVNDVPFFLPRLVGGQQKWNDFERVSGKYIMQGSAYLYYIFNHFLMRNIITIPWIKINIGKICTHVCSYSKTFSSFLLHRKVLHVHIFS